MTDRDSTQSAPLAPPHYELLSHPLVHAPHSPCYVSCLDTLHNAACLLDLFGHLELDDDSDRGGLSTNAAEAFFWLAKMLRDTLFYVSKNLEDTGGSGEVHHVEERLQQSMFLKAMQVPIGASQSHIYDTMASCLGISRADVEEFIGMAEGLQNRASDSQEEEIESSYY